jgi:hypothetical protein
MNLFGGIFARNLPEYYRKSVGATTKKKILGCSFSKKLAFFKKKCNPL